MIVVMNNDGVSIYQIKEDEFKISNINDYEKYKINYFSKIEYSPNKLFKITGSFPDAFYYDNGKKMIKKSIKDINDIVYYKDENGKLWPSESYYKYSLSKASLEPQIATLFELDNKLNKCCKLHSIFQGAELDEFRNFYDKASIDKGLPEGIRGTYYDVTTFAKIMINPLFCNDKKITADRLVDSVFVTVTPIGKKDDGNILYYINDIQLKKVHTDDIYKVFKSLLNQDNLVVPKMNYKEKLSYYEKATLESFKSENDILNEMNDQNVRVLFDSKGITWSDYQKKFLDKYGFEVDDFDSSKWLIFKTDTLDARTIHNGHIVLLTLEYYQSNIISKKKSEEALSDLRSGINEHPIMGIDELMATSEKKDIDIQENIEDDYVPIEDETIAIEDNIQKKDNLDNSVLDLSDLIIKVDDNIDTNTLSSMSQSEINNILEKLSEHPNNKFKFIDPEEAIANNEIYIPTGFYVDEEDND